MESSFNFDLKNVTVKTAGCADVKDDNGTDIKIEGLLIQMSFKCDPDSYVKIVGALAGLISKVIV